MAKTKQSCFGEGTKSRAENPHGLAINLNPYKTGSWQYTAWFQGWSSTPEPLPGGGSLHYEGAQIGIMRGLKIEVEPNKGNAHRLPTDAPIKAIRADQARVDALQFEFSDYMPDACAHHCALLTVTVENVFNPTPSQISWLTRLTRKVEALQAKYAKRYESAMQTA